MKEDKIIQFVCFETILDSDEFLAKWEKFTRSVNSNHHVTLQQSEKNGLFRYVAQHRFPVSEFQFIFEKARRSSKNPEVSIKVEQAGGYFISHEERKGEARTGESKIFAFINNPRADMEVYRGLNAHAKLNIYEPYYENSRYNYILEFFIKNNYTEELLNQLKEQHVTETGIYKECATQLS